MLIIRMSGRDRHDDEEAERPPAERRPGPRRE